jgi:hypothetical protein
MSSIIVPFHVSECKCAAGWASVLAGLYQERAEPVGSGMSKAVEAGIWLFLRFREMGEPFPGSSCAKIRVILRFLSGAASVSGS